MFAQSFISADELGITEPQRGALQKVLVLLETGKLRHITEAQGAYTPTSDKEAKSRFDGLFNMGVWSSTPSECGTVGCIGGTAELLAGSNIFQNGFLEEGQSALGALFFPAGPWDKITTTQAARALRSYLTCGDAKWAEAVSVERQP